MIKDRNTIQRDLVRHAVSVLPHPTAEEVYASIYQKHPSVSKATVYRNLGVLVDKGEIMRFTTGEASVRYDHNPSRHYHAQCEGCGCVIDVFLAEEEEETIQKAVAQLAQKGFTTVDYSMIFRGVCKACKS